MIAQRWLYFLYAGALHNIFVRKPAAAAFSQLAGLLSQSLSACQHYNV